MRLARLLALAAAAGLWAGPAAAEELTTCHLTYDLSGWSAFYKRYTGTGDVRCDNGQRAAVALELHGGGFTFGRSEIEDGKGTFSGVKDISEIFGTYAAAEGHAGVTQSAEGRVMTKGQVSLALSGTGRGVDLGFAFSGFTIRRR